MQDIRDKRVVVTGGAGFLGRAVVATLRDRGCGAVFAPRKKEYDLTDRANTQRLFQDLRPDIVIHLAGTVGGTGANRAHPGNVLLRKRHYGHRVDRAGEPSRPGEARARWDRLRLPQVLPRAVSRR